MDEIKFEDFTGKRFSNANEAFEQINNGMINGNWDLDHRDARGMKSINMSSSSLSITNPLNRIVTNKTRNIKRHYAAASVIWNLALRNDVNSIVWWNEEGKRITDDGLTFYGANYGERMHGYLEAAIELLKYDSETRRAWIPIWQGEDLVTKDLLGSQDEPQHWELGYSKDGNDVPCTIGFSISIRNLPTGDVLDMDVSMRSQSIYGVFPYDVFLFTVYQELIANELGIKVGEYRHNMISCHIYEREFESCKKAVSTVSPTPSPMMPINLTFTEATKNLPSEFDSLIDGNHASLHDFKNDENLNPLISMMLPYARQQHNIKEGNKK